jgi:hypothetical protein
VPCWVSAPRLSPHASPVAGPERGGQTVGCQAVVVAHSGIAKGRKVFGMEGAVSGGGW